MKPRLFTTSTTLAATDIVPFVKDLGSGTWGERNIPVANMASELDARARTIDDTLAPSGDTGTLINLLSWLANIIKGITGKASWRTAPRTTLENALKLNGDTMTGALVLSGAPTTGLNPATKTYADAGDATNAAAASAAQTTANAALPKAGGTMTGAIVLAADPAAALQPATKQYTDAADATLTTAAAAAQTTANAALPKAGGTMTGALVGTTATLNQLVLTPTSLTYAATTNIDFDSPSFRTLSLTGNVTFTTSNKAAGKTVTLKILCDGTLRTLTFPAWVFVGAAAPANIAAGKLAVLTLTCFGTADTDIVAAYAVQP